MLPVESLQPTSSVTQIKQAIAESIDQCRAEGKTYEQCSGRVYLLAEKATGKDTGMLTQPGMAQQMQPPQMGGMAPGGM